MSIGFDSIGMKSIGLSGGPYIITVDAIFAPLIAWAEEMAASQAAPIEWAASVSEAHSAHIIFETQLHFEKTVNIGISKIVEAQLGLGAYITLYPEFEFSIPIAYRADVSFAHTAPWHFGYYYESSFSVPIGFGIDGNSADVTLAFDTSILVHAENDIPVSFLSGVDGIAPSLPLDWKLELYGQAVVTVSSSLVVNAERILLTSFAAIPAYTSAGLFVFGEVDEKEDNTVWYDD